MDILAGMVILLMYFSPFLFVGLLIFVCLAFVTVMTSKLSPIKPTARRNFIYIGLSISFVAAILLSIPVTVSVLFNNVEDKNKPKDDAVAKLKQEMHRDGRDQAWPAGTITSLDRWVEREGGQYRDELRLAFSNHIALKIDTNKLQTDDADFAIIEKLAQRPHAVDGYSDYLLASTIAYVHLKHSGLDDVGHPERFRRSPGHNPSANGTDYTTYLKVAIVRCTQQPELADCRDTFTEKEVIRFETMPDHSNPLNWLERKNLLPPLRIALGYPVSSQ